MLGLSVIAVWTLTCCQRNCSVVWVDPCEIEQTIVCSEACCRDAYAARSECEARLRNNNKLYCVIVSSTVNLFRWLEESLNRSCKVLRCSLASNGQTATMSHLA